MTCGSKTVNNLPSDRPPSATFWMRHALSLAHEAAQQGEVPVGALVVYQGQVLAQAHNRMHQTQNPTLHAEMQAISLATACLQSTILQDCQLYVTLEPCPMCAHALRLAQIPTLYFGAYDVRGGAIDHGPHLYEDKHFFRPEVYGGILEHECQAILTHFFKTLRGSTL